MSNRRWLFPVRVICTRTNQTLKVGTTREAWKMLLDMWPVADGHRFLSALKICMDVEHGIGEPADARDAFIAAAEEAGVAIETCSASSSVISTRRSRWRNARLRSRPPLL